MQSFVEMANRYKLKETLSVTLDNDNARQLVNKNRFLIDAHKLLITQPDSCSDSQPYPSYLDTWQVAKTHEYNHTVSQLRDNYQDLMRKMLVLLREEGEWRDEVIESRMGR